jgi:hypothetical protein
MPYVVRAGAISSLSSLSVVVVWKREEFDSRVLGVIAACWQVRPCSLRRCLRIRSATVTPCSAEPLYELQVGVTGGKGNAARFHRDGCRGTVTGVRGLCNKDISDRQVFAVRAYLSSSFHLCCMYEDGGEFWHWPFWHQFYPAVCQQ